MQRGGSPGHAPIRRGTPALLAALLLAVLLLAGCGSGGAATPGTSAPAGSGSQTPSSAATSAAPPTATPSASVAPSGSSSARPSVGPTAKPVASVKGSGFVDSKKFSLAAGDYLVRWTLTSKAAGGCAAIGAIHTPDGLVSVEVANTSVAGKASRSGSHAAPKLAAGTYLVTFATTCSWTAQVYRD